ncbi:UNVERIFIED_CONTAM: hypothetical protein FKN15_046597 [Acipenser sinensis]
MKLAQEEKDFWKALENLKQDLEQEALAIEETNHQLRQQINKQKEKLEFMRSENESLQQKFKIIAAIPEKAVKFIGVEKEIPDHKLEEDCLHIQGQFSIIQNPALTLSGGQAVITFEEEQAAIPEKAVKFIGVEKEIPDHKLEEDCLHIQGQFSIIQNPALTLSGGQALITFEEEQVAERLAMMKTYPFDTGHKVSEVFVSLCTEHRLKKFQTFCGTSRRTVLLSGISDVLDEEDLQDNLEIHFQKPNNYGGEVENIKYNAQGQTTVAYFNEETALCLIGSKVKMDRTPEARTIVVSGVPQHELDCRRMADKLVIHFQKAKSAGGDVEKIKYPTSIKGVAYITFEEKEEVDLSLSSEHEKLVKELQTRYRAVRISPLQANQRVQVEGPFTAIKKLREDLLQLLETSQREKSVMARDQRRERQSSRAVTPEQGAAPFSSETDASNTEACLIWLDTNVFRYIQHVHKDDFDWILKKHDVQAATQVEGELTGVTLKKSYQGLWQLETAKLEIEQWVSNVQSCLRTETIHYEKVFEEEKFLQACKDVSCGFPRVLFTPVEGHIDIIGNSSDCYLFCQLVEMQMKSSLHDKDRWLSTSPGATDMSYYSTGRTGEPNSLPMSMNSDMHRMPGNNVYSSMHCDSWSER